MKAPFAKAAQSFYEKEGITVSSGDEPARSDNGGLILKLDMYQTMALAVLALFLGAFLRKKINSVGFQANMKVLLRTRSSVPACIFTRPEIAVVGISEQQAKEQGIRTAAGKAVLYSNARTLISGTGRSFMKVIADKEDGRILGASLMCSHATEMISELSEAIDNGLTVSQMLRVIRPHPTFHETLTDALEDLDRKLDASRPM